MICQSIKRTSDFQTNGYLLQLVPVEVPKHNYLADKQLSNQELKNAWKVFEYSGIKQNLQGGTSQIDDDEQSNRDTGLMSNHHSPSNLPVPMPVHSNMQSPQMSPQMPPISVSVNGVPVNPVLMHQNHQPSSNMQPQVIYQRYDTADLDLENIKESVRDSSKDSLHSYKDHNRDYSSKHSLPKLKRRSSLKRKISKKVFYDYD